MARAKLDPAHPYMRHPLKPHQLATRVTPTEGAIVLCHLGVPQLSGEDWSLTIDGLVARPTQLSFAALRALPKVTLESVHVCCGSPLQPEVPQRRVTNVVWGGALLSDIIRACEPNASAKYLLSRGADYGVFDGVECDAFEKDLPLWRLRQRDDVLIAYEMNEAPLKPEHGYPARLVVPGWYGTNSVKWLTRVTLSEGRGSGPFVTRWYNDVVRNVAGRPTSEKWTPVWAIAPESAIVWPAPAQVLAGGDSIEVWGWAWGDGGARGVEFSADGGAHWTAARVEPVDGRQWQRFEATWLPDRAGSFELTSRAHSSDGRTQPPDGARNAIYRVPVRIVASAT